MSGVGAAIFGRSQRTVGPEGGTEWSRRPQGVPLSRGVQPDESSVSVQWARGRFQNPCRA
jgi:hypothetical protein